MRKLTALDEDTFDKLKQLGRDQMLSLQDLADEAFMDLLEKHGVPADLKDALRKSAAAEIAVGAASVAEILSLNILHASMLAMRRAVLRLREPPDLALVDGNRAPPGLPCPVECCIGGDATSLSIAAASIVAKVVRDRAMTRLASRYPVYAWHENAGYATPTHRAALRNHGPSCHHRAAFGTVRLVAQAELELEADAAD